jgi:hypothetical protein
VHAHATGMHDYECEAKRTLHDYESSQYHYPFARAADPKPHHPLAPTRRPSGGAADGARDGPTRHHRGRAYSRRILARPLVAPIATTCFLIMIISAFAFASQTPDAVCAH